MHTYGTQRLKDNLQHKSLGLQFGMKKWEYSINHQDIILKVNHYL